MHEDKRCRCLCNFKCSLSAYVCVSFLYVAACVCVCVFVCVCALTLHHFPTALAWLYCKRAGACALVCMRVDVCVCVLACKRECVPLHHCSTSRTPPPCREFCRLWLCVCACVDEPADKLPHFGSLQKHKRCKRQACFFWVGCAFSIYARVHLFKYARNMCNIHTCTRACVHKRVSVCVCVYARKLVNTCVHLCHLHFTFCVSFFFTFCNRYPQAHSHTYTLGTHTNL